MSDRIVLDIHTHIIPVIEDLLAEFDGILWNEDRMSIDGHVVGITSIYQPEALLAWMDRQRVDHAWVSAPPPTYRPHLKGDAARRWCSYLNEGLANIASSYKGRLTALLHLPTQDPQLAAEIAQVWAARGATNFSMPTGTGDERAISEPEFDALWAALDRVDATVFMHPGECADGRLKIFYLHNLLGNPSETAVAICHMMLGGIMERYPGIKLGFAHAGGSFPMVAGRLQRGFDTKRPGLDIKRQPPNVLATDVFVDCICHGQAQFDLAEETFGSNNIVFGSDWPFPMGIVEPHAQLAGLPPVQRDRVMRSNAATLIK